MKLMSVLLSFFCLCSSVHAGYLTLGGNKDSYAESKDFPAIGGFKEFTFESRINCKDFGEWSGILVLGKSRKESYFAISATKDGEIEVWFREKDEDRIVVRSAVKLKPSRWYHMAVVYNGNAVDSDAAIQNELSLKIFIEGKLIESKYLTKDGKKGAVIPPELPSIKKGLKLGTIGSRGNWSGKIEEVRLWNKALTREIVTEWNEKRVDDTHPFSDALISYYDMKPVEKNIINDISGEYPLSFVGKLSKKNLFIAAGSNDFTATLSEEDPDYIVFNESEENRYNLGKKVRDPFHEVVKERDPSELTLEELDAVKNALKSYKLRAVIQGQSSTCFFNKGKFKLGDTIRVKLANKTVKVLVYKIKEKPLGVVLKVGSLEVIKEIKR